MEDARSTCWTMIEEAGKGRHAPRDAFARRYGPVIEAYLRARWRGTPLMQETHDALQDVFVECFKRDGALGRAERDRPGGFRAFLYGVLRNVARRFEAKRGRSRERQPATDMDLDKVATAADPLSQVFDRSFAQAVMKEAAARQTQRAREKGQEAERRIDLLRLRFEHDLPIREIARQWDQDPAHLHRQYALARREFKASLVHVLGFYHPGQPDRIEAECASLLGLLSSR